MSNLFDASSGAAGDVALRCAGAVSPALVSAAYPMAELTKYHLTHHIPGITGRWMDLRNADMAFAGNFHRLSHGHHLFKDGFKVLVNPNLKYGEFLHHLGMDILTSRGIPFPFIPDAVAPLLIKMGLPSKFAYELLTINVPKILGGSLGLVCAGADVVMVFSDAIPHTFGAAGMQMLGGIISIAAGCFPPNPLLWIAGGVQLACSTVTAYRAFVDPILPFVGVPGSVFLPVLGDAVGLSLLVSVCAGIFTGKNWGEIAKSAVSASAAASIATAVGISSQSGVLAGLSSTFIAPFLGPAAGIITYLIVNKLLNSNSQNISSQQKNQYKEYSDLFISNYFRDTKSTEYFSRRGSFFAEQTFGQGFFSAPSAMFDSGVVLPTFSLSNEPLGELKDDVLKLSTKQLSKIEGLYA